jgi:RNA polymerase sigma-70 factor (ECF subfamily)
MARPLSESALREWMRALGPRLVTLSAAICRDRDRAGEIVQEAFIKLWQRPPDAGEAAYPSWLRRVTVNLSINALKRTRRPAALPEHTTDRSLTGGAQPAERCETQESLRRVQAALGRLDEPKRTILLLRAWEQLSYEEIADHLGVPVGTVMSRLNRARRALMDELEREGAAAQEPPIYAMRNYRTA